MHKPSEAECFGKKPKHSVSYLSTLSMAHKNGCPMQFVDEYDVYVIILSPVGFGPKTALLHGFQGF